MPIQIKPREEALAYLRAWRNRPVPQEVIPEAGATMPDSSICVGISPNTGKPFFAMPADASVTMYFNDAAQYVEEFNKNKTLGHSDWRLPTIEELKLLFGMQLTGSFSGTFNHASRSPSNTSSLYWSSSRPEGPIGINNVRCIRFSGNGVSQFHYPDDLLSVRLVR